MNKCKILFFFVVCVMFSCVSYAQNVRQYWENISDSLIVNKANATVTKDEGNLLEAEITSALSIQLKVMGSKEMSPLLCLVRTYMAPEKDSVVEIYDEKWQRLTVQKFGLEDIIGKDNASRFAKYFEPLLIYASLCNANDDITLTICDKMLSDEDKKELGDFSLTKTLKWNADVSGFQ